MIQKKLVLDRLQYPIPGICAILTLIYLSPFVGAWLNYLAFSLYICRLAKYDVRTFSIDYSCLISVAAAPDELKNGLALIINNKEIRTEYAKRAKRLATQKHDMASVSRQIKDQIGVILRNEANGSKNIREN